MNIGFKRYILIIFLIFLELFYQLIRLFFICLQIYFFIF